ncbi:MAG: hypothetical protein ACYDBQ_12315 [Thermoplasmatota archaeon]
MAALKQTLNDQVIAIGTPTAALERISLSMNLHPSSARGAPQSLTAAILFQVGSNGVLHVHVAVANSGTRIAADEYCSAQGVQSLQYGATVLVSRPYPAGRCGTASTASSSDPIGLDAALLTANLTAKRLPTGGIEATAKNATASTTYDLDPNDRMTHASFSGPQSDGNFTSGCGPRQSIQIPAPTGRAPADIQLTRTEDNATFTTYVVITSSDVKPATGEIKVVVSQYNDTGEKELANVTLATTRQVDGGFAVTYQDMDADGRVSANDTFTIVDLRPEDAPFLVSLYDSWAGARVGSLRGIPSLATVAAVGALVIAALARKQST